MAERPSVDAIMRGHDQRMKAAEQRRENRRKALDQKKEADAKAAHVSNPKTA